MLPSKHSAFTLIELLVVVAIISVLAALLMPALRSAVDQAHSIACMANLKQISLAYGMYADDNRNWYPAGKHLIPNGGPGLTWAGFLYPYLDISRPNDPNTFWWFAHERIFLCPAKEGKRLEWGTSSYGQVWFNWPKDFEGQYWKVNQFGGKTILAADTRDKSNGMGNIHVFRGAKPNTRHLGRANFIRWDLAVVTSFWELSSAAAPKYDSSNKLTSPTSGADYDWLSNNW